MSIININNGFKTTIGGVALGVGLAVVAPIVFPILASIIKPLTKAVIKEGVSLYKKGQETLTEAKETVEDLMAEAKSEIAEDRSITVKGRKKAAPAPPNPIAKAIMDESRALYDKGKGMITEARETVEQLVEEAKSEIAASAAAEKS